MTDAIQTNLGRKLEQLSADSGYCSDANIEVLETRGIDGYIATGRAKDAAASTTEASLAASDDDCRRHHQNRPAPNAREAMREKIKAGGHDSIPATQAVMNGVRADQAGAASAILLR